MILPTPLTRLLQPLACSVTSGPGCFTLLSFVSQLLTGLLNLSVHVNCRTTGGSSSLHRLLLMGYSGLFLFYVYINKQPTMERVV